MPLKIRKGVKRAKKAINKATSQIPLVGKFSDEKYRDLFKPKELNAKYREYRASVDLATGLKNTETFKNYVAERKTHLTDFSDLKLPDKLSKDFKAAFTDAMVLSDNTKKAQENIEKTFSNLNNLINADPPDIDLNSIASALQQLRKNAEIAVNIQHKEEIKKVKDLFATPKFKQELQNDLQLDDHQIALFEKDTLAALEKAQKEEKNKLDTNFQNEVTRLLAHHQAERNRIAFLAIMYENNLATKAAIDELRQKINNRKQTTLSDGDVGGLATFKGVKVTDLGLFQTIGGTNVYNDNGAFRIKLPKLFENYTTTMADFTTLAQAVKACGNTTISVDIKYEYDQDHAMELGRRAYEAAVLAGFDPAETPDEKDKEKTKKFITINVNGKPILAQDLFSKEPERLQRIKHAYANRLQKRTDIAEHYDKMLPTTSQFKELLEEIKTETKHLEDIQNNPAQLPGPGAVPV